MSYKFIFDSSVFDSKSINKLAQSDLKNAVRDGWVAFYLTPIFLNECFDFLSGEKLPQSMLLKLQFLYELKWQKIFNGTSGQDGIYTRELENDLSGKYLFLHKSNIRESLYRIIQGKQFSDAEKEALRTYKDRWREGKKNNKILLNQIRKNEKPEPTFTFEDYLDHSFESTAIFKIQKRINSDKSRDDLVRFWKSNKHKCPHFNKFVEGEMFILWAAQQERGLKIDENSMDDIEHLVYLNDVDGIVSNEYGFMKKAKEKLFPRKDYFSVDSFIEFLRNRTN